MKRVSLGVFDQALLSGSNVLFILALGRTLDPREFGYYALCYTALMAATALCRGGIGTPLLVKSGQVSGVKSEAGSAMAFILLIGVPLSALGALAITTIPLPVHPVLAAGLLIVPLQDSVRLAAVALQKVSHAIIGDGLWFICSAVLFAQTWAEANLSAASISGAWLCAGLFATLCIAFQVHVKPSFSGLMRWLTTESEDRVRFAFEASISAGGALATAGSVNAFIGPAANAALRGASTLIGPMNVLLTSLQVAVVPQLRGQDDQSYRNLTKKTLPLTALVAILAIMVSLFALLAPEKVGQLILGQSWVLVAPVLAIYGAEYVGQAYLANAMTILRARIDSRRLLRIRMTLTGTQLLACILAALITRSAIGVAAASFTVVWTVAIASNAWLRWLERDAKRN